MNVISWAREITIVVNALPTDIVNRARRHYGSGKPLTEGGVVAFTRHEYTNYAKLVRRLMDFAAPLVETKEAKDKLKYRANNAAWAALEARGLL